MAKKKYIQATICASLAVFILFLLHHLPVNQLFIDPFSEAIKNHDIMDVGISRFRNHTDPSLFDNNIVILNSEKTNRKEIAEVIQYLSKSDVAGIGIDLIFDRTPHNAIDTMLSTALKSEKVVLGYTFEEMHEGETHSIHGTSSDELFVHRDEQLGYVNLATNDGFSVRAFEPFHTIDGIQRESFALKLASKLNPESLKITKDRQNKIEWINFKRLQPGIINMAYPINDHKSVHYAFTSVNQFLIDTASYSSEYLKDKIVLIGFNGEDDDALSMKDRYFTPLNQIYHGRSLPDMYGVVVHANIISMLLTKDYINEIPEWILYLIGFLIFFINYFIFQKLEDKKLFTILPLVRLVQLIQFVILFSFCIIMITYFNVKFGFILIITAVIISFEVYELYDHKLRHKVSELYTTKVLKKDFSRPNNHH